MMKRETLKELARVIRKFGYTPNRQDTMTLADNLGEAMDEIDLLKAKVADAWNEGYHAGSLDMDNGIDKDDDRRELNPYGVTT